MSGVNKINNYLRHQRFTRGWSLKRVADEIRMLGIKEDGKEPGVNADMVGEWERGIKVPSPYYREKLCQIYNTTADQLGFLAASTASPTYEYQQPITHVLVGNNDMNKKRRELLHLLSLAGSTIILPLPDLDWDRIDGAIAKPSRLDDIVLRDLETMNNHYWNIYHASFSKALVLDGVLKQLKMLVGFLEDTHTTPLHKWLCKIASDLSQLAGEVFFDGNDYDAAQSCYVFSAVAAKEATAYDLWACALIRHAYLHIFDEQYEDAIPLLRQAKRLAQRGDSSLSTRFWVEAVDSNAQSGIGNLTSCQHALAKARGVIHMSETSSNGGWLRFNGMRLPEQQGTCYVLLGQPHLAEPALQEALTQLQIVSRRRAMILTDLAKAYLQKHEVEQACTIASEVIEIAMQRPSGVISKGIHSLRDQLKPYTSLAEVKEFNQHVGLLL